MGPSQSLVTGQPLLTILAVKLLTPPSKLQEKKTFSSLSEKYNEFIELAAHDLDSPIRKLSMLLERISNKFEAGPDKDMQGYMLRTRACLADMHRMVEDLSLFARFNLPIIKNVACDLENIITSAWKELPGLPAEKS
jgi:light-regulated signal transduction histidine kinase (bacteriophytochrome)